MSVKCIHNAGFFSCCSVKLNHITYFINLHKAFPRIVDSSAQFDWYKTKKHKNNDITYEYFTHYTNVQNIQFTCPINYHHSYQFINYSSIDYKGIIPIIKKYFSPSNDIENIINMFVYQMRNYSYLQ